MDVVWLESLLALLEHGSFSRAADALHISQPALSRRIRSLEQWAGAELVDRSTYPVSLTPAGAKLRVQAAEVVTGLAEVRDELRGRQMMPREAARFAVSHTLAIHYFPSWWKLLTGDVTGLTCLLLTSNTVETYDALLHGGCDLLLAYADPVQPLGIDRYELESLVLARDRFAPYSQVNQGRPRFMLPGDPDRPVPCVSHGSGAFLGRVTDRLSAVERLYLRPVAQSDLTTALAELVFAGVGVGWLPEVVAAPAAAAGTVVEVGGGAWSTELEIRLYRHRSSNQRANPSAEQVWTRAQRMTQREH